MNTVGSRIASVMVIALVLGLGAWVPAAHAGAALAFPEMPGWTLAGPAQSFAPETLYEYIDGGADLYLKYEFEELQVAEYRNDGKAVTVEVYRHRGPNHAFGIYSQERFPSAEYLAVGAQGYRESGVLNFVKGNVYVKISSYPAGSDDREALDALARRLAARVAGQDTLPELLATFPPEGKKPNSERFVARDFLGYSFFHDAFTAEYEVAGKTFRLFVMRAETRDQCRVMLEQYLRQVGQGPTALAEGRMPVRDRYHGEMELSWTGPFIWGAIGLGGDAELRGKYLARFEQRSRP